MNYFVLKKCLDKTLTLQVKRRCWNHAGDYDGERQTDRQTNKQTDRYQHRLPTCWRGLDYPKHIIISI